MESALEGASGVATSPGRGEIGLYQRGRDRFSAPQDIPAVATCCMMERQDRSPCRGRCRMPLDFGPGAGKAFLCAPVFAFFALWSPLFARPAPPPLDYHERRLQHGRVRGAPGKGLPPRPVVAGVACLPSSLACVPSSSSSIFSFHRIGTWPASEPSRPPWKVHSPG